MEFVFELLVENKETCKTKEIDLTLGYDDAKDELLSLITDEQIAEEINLEKPVREDYESNEDFEEAMEEYKDELEDYRNDMEYEDFDKFLEIISIDNSFKIEVESFEELESVINTIEEIVDEDDWIIVYAIHKNTYNDLEKAVSIYTSGDYYWYSNMDLEDVVEEKIDSGVWGEIPDNIRYYLDIEKMARDLSHEGYVYDSEVNGVIYVY